MRQFIPQPPNRFDVKAFAERWFHWSEVNKCFWPGAGGRSKRVNPELAPVRYQGGVYVMAWSKDSPDGVGPTAPAVQYVGETSSFKDRMGQFGTSAAFWGERDSGHGPAWHWPEGRTEKLWVAFFVVGELLRPHLAEGMRRWMEAVALEEYRQVHGDLPPLQLASAADRILELD